MSVRRARRRAIIAIVPLCEKWSLRKTKREQRKKRVSKVLKGRAKAGK